MKISSVVEPGALRSVLEYCTSKEVICQVDHCATPEDLQKEGEFNSANFGVVVTNHNRVDRMGDDQSRSLLRLPILIDLMGRAV
ncbi:MAG: hypothetical protein ACLP05_04560 [Candidatus Kryptoniota bacterium]